MKQLLLVRSLLGLDVVDAVTQVNRSVEMKSYRAVTRQDGLEVATA